jgi:hypothetical protein
MSEPRWPLAPAEYEALLLRARIERSRVINVALRVFFAASARWLRRTGGAALHPFVTRGRRNDVRPAAPRYSTRIPCQRSIEAM